MPFSTGSKLVERIATVTFDGTGNKLLYQAVRPILVHRIFAIVIVATDGNVVLVGDHQNVDGTALSPDGVNMTGDCSSGGALAVNLGWYKDADDFPQGEPILVVPGERFVLRVATAAPGAGDGAVGFEYELLPFVAGNRKRQMSDGSIVTASLLGNLRLATG